MLVVTLQAVTPDPIRVLYTAYRTCYSALSAEAIARRIDNGRVSREEMEAFVLERLKTGHTSPLEQVNFTFALSGVSRAFSHQFVRTRVGFSPEQQSQRYVVEKDGLFDFVIPPSIAKNELHKQAFTTAMGYAGAAYEFFVSEGVPAEDARFVLPNAAETQLQVTLNLAALLHMGDIRLCTQAQWEYRKVVALMRAEVVKVVPLLGKQINVKCQPQRHGVCDESYATWLHCPLGGGSGRTLRPHKSQLERLRGATIDDTRPAVRPV